MLNNHITGISLLNSHIENMIEAATSSVYWKDTNGKYLGINSEFIRSSNMQSADNIIGKKDVNIFPEHYAVQLRANDQEVIKRELPRTFIESVKSVKSINKKVNEYISYKSPLRSRTGKIIGVFGFSVIKAKDNSLNSLLDNINSLINPAAYNKSQVTAVCGLTDRQYACLFYIVKGLTMKQIAKELDLSPRTVELHIQSLKRKLDCTTRAELIEKALQISEMQGGTHATCF